jgi:hypothetical protein
MQPDVLQMLAADSTVHAARAKDARAAAEAWRPGFCAFFDRCKLAFGASLKYLKTPSVEIGKPTVGESFFPPPPRQKWKF